jgi:nucleoside-diphosphate-sugar epimerase
MDRILILGGGGFIGGSLAARLMAQGHYVRIVDLKMHEFRDHAAIANDYIIGDLRDHKTVKDTLTSDIDTVFQLAADMGGAGYVFTGEHDADIMHNSAMINLHVAEVASKVKPNRIFYSSSACMYPEHNQMDPLNPNCAEDSAYPAAPDSEYGWEKLFSERMFLAFSRNYKLNVKIARFHNIFGPHGTFDGGREKAPAAMIRKVLSAEDHIDVWGDGKQTRSFLYIEDCLDALLQLTYNDRFSGPVNIGSEEMVTIDELARLAIRIADRPELQIRHIDGPMGVRGRCSDNLLILDKLGWEPKFSLDKGMRLTAAWIRSQMNL